MRTTWTLRLLALFTASLVSGCGWHLRGGSDVPALGSIHISAQNARGELVENLRDALRGGGVKLTDNAGDADYKLIILEQRSDSRTATVNVGARIAELMLTEEADFIVLNRAGEPALARSTASVERIFEYTENNALASDDETLLIKREMQTDLANQIINRLNRVRKTQSATPGSSTKSAPAASDPPAPPLVPPNAAAP
ncbi:MAG: LPS assembly lipoprotein LptE [Porticoccaceae bacterium]